MGILNKGIKEYSRHYSEFRGVDFSNDHSQVHPSRLAYLVNMYKDYQSGQGEALETIAGFRQRASFSFIESISDGIVNPVGRTSYNAQDSPDASKICGIFHFKDGGNTDRTVVHSGTKLWLWNNYPDTINIPTQTVLNVPELNNNESVEETLNFTCAAIIRLEKITGYGSFNTISVISYNANTKILKYATSSLAEGDRLLLTYYEGVTSSADLLYSSMASKKSNSFVFYNKLYILDGTNYLMYDGTTAELVKNSAGLYVPTIYNQVKASGENVIKEREYEQRNILTPKFEIAYVGDGTTTVYELYHKNLDNSITVKIDGVGQSNTDNSTIYVFDSTNGTLTFTTAPAENANVEVILSKDVTFSKSNSAQYKTIFENAGETAFTEYSGTDLISKCTMCTTYDGRVFLTGNPNFHNYIFFCGRDLTGYTNPTYFGVLNYMQDGVGLAPITGIMSVSDTLMVLKSDTQQDSSVYFHTGTDTGNNIIPRVYPSSQGLSGLGCIGACCNFLDDPVFISRLGVEGVSRLKIASERSNEHRSRLVDAKLVNSHIHNARLEEWGGYLCILVDGKMFMADSRQRYQDSTGIMQYEWYYIEGIGVWEGQYTEYTYSKELPSELVGQDVEHEDGNETLTIPIELASEVSTIDENEVVIKDLRGVVCNSPNANGSTTKVVYTTGISVDGDLVEVNYVIHEINNVKHAYLCETRGNHTGGVYKQATVLKTISDNLFFGAENGIVCSFNFDKRDSDGEIPAQYYSFDGRTIFCGCATVMDNCGMPHLTKSTIKRSTVVKTKSFRHSSAKLKVRTDKKPYAQVTETKVVRINNSLFSFEDMDFADFTFLTAEQSVYAIKEKEKQWVEKQYFIYSDEYLRPFAVYSISYRYKVSGRVK